MNKNDEIRIDAPKHYSFRLFIAGNALNSRIAKENLRQFIESSGKSRFQIEIIDVMENPQAALEHGIFVTPALQVIEPDHGGLLYGNLSDWDALRSVFPEED